MERLVEPIDEICSSSETDHISLSSVSDCVSEISLAAEPQPINALPASKPVAGEERDIKGQKTSLRKRFRSWLLPKHCVRK
ncbi:hypothetical protein DPEC_G00024540 [Dallia pectoralis]|uniref:Uncharacterized protein n=1 Tax=Dallia pectoralis TaxID=75939 RepID=A0ACC2HH93_DALPE|nr:hypothetical protein DPEC_G00024540 [Dallia pectoralis]